MGERNEERPDDPVRCVACERPLAGRRVYRLRLGQAFVLKCLSCSFVDRPLALRSARVALVVGTLLLAINQGDKLLSGEFPWAKDGYKIPLTYMVPFCVATYGALSNGYRGRG